MCAVRNDRYPHVFSPLKIRGVTLKNRLEYSPTVVLKCTPEGDVTEEMLDYVEYQAKTGVAYLTIGNTPVVHTGSSAWLCELNVTEDRCIHGINQLVVRARENGAEMSVELAHAGRGATTMPGVIGLAPSDVPLNGGPLGYIKPMNHEDMAFVKQQFVDCAVRCQKAGLKILMIHCGHNNLLAQFLSPASNHRTDEYGGSLENRTRILREVVEAIRAACGRDFPLMFRISLEEYIGREGYHADTGIQICQMLASWGVDAINVTASGTDSKLSQSVEPMYYPQGWRKHLPKAVKRTVPLPVVSVALIRDPAYGEKLLEEGVLDFVASARSHLADPDWGNKARQGREEEILPCISCMACFGKYEQAGHITCAVNPETGYEAQLPPLPQDGEGRLVVVLGGGPAGLEGAWVAARRGFRVILFEKAPQLGGQLLLAAGTPRKEKIQWLLDSLCFRCRQAGVELRTGCAPTLKELGRLSPYAILDATGGVPGIPAAIQGARESPLVCTPPAVITGALDIREESVVVVGSGMTGLETAELLSDRARNNAVLVLEAAPRLAPGVQGSNRNGVTAVLEVNNVVFLCNRTLTRVGEDRIWFVDSQTGEEYVYPCDRVVLALGTVPARPYGDRLGEVCSRVIPVGDAVKGGQIWDAVHAGYHGARRI